jgi:hypothetical protein
MQFKYQSSSRNALTVAALLAAILCLACGIVYGAPLVWLLIAGVAVAVLLLSVLVNSKFGMLINESEMAWYDGRDEYNVALNDIEYVKLTEWSENFDVDVVLASGESLRVDSHCVPELRRLRKALHQFGINVVDA